MGVPTGETECIAVRNSGLEKVWFYRELFNLILIRDSSHVLTFRSTQFNKMWAYKSKSVWQVAFVISSSRGWRQADWKVDADEKAVVTAVRKVILQQLVGWLAEEEGEEGVSLNEINLPASWAECLKCHWLCSSFTKITFTLLQGARFSSRDAIPVQDAEWTCSGSKLLRERGRDPKQIFDFESKVLKA